MWRNKCNNKFSSILIDTRKNEINKSEKNTKSSVGFDTYDRKSIDELDIVRLVSMFRCIDSMNILVERTDKKVLTHYNWHKEHHFVINVRIYVNKEKDNIRFQYEPFYVLQNAPWVLVVLITRENRMDEEQVEKHLHVVLDNSKVFLITRHVLNFDHDRKYRWMENPMMYFQQKETKKRRLYHNFFHWTFA